MNITNSFKKLTLTIISSVFLLNACGDEKSTVATNVEDKATKTYQWKMVTSWPKNFPGLGMGPEKFSQYVDEMSNGRLTVKVYGSGELVFFFYLSLCISLVFLFFPTAYCRFSR